MQFDLIDWSAKELHLPLGASRKVAYLIAKDTDREDVAAWEATPNREPALFVESAFRRRRADIGADG